MFWNILEWTVWGVVAFYSLGLLLSSNRDGAARFMMRTQGFVLALGLAATAYFPFSKFHLLWVAPFAFLSAFPIQMLMIRFRFARLMRQSALPDISMGYNSREDGCNSRTDGGAKPRTADNAATDVLDEEKCATVEQLIGIGDAKCEAGEYRGAVADYTRAIAVLPHMILFYKRAIAKMAMEEYNNAIVDCTEAIARIAPNGHPTILSSLYYLRHDAKRLLGFTEEAESDLRKAHELLESASEE